METMVVFVEILISPTCMLLTMVELTFTLHTSIGQRFVKHNITYYSI